MILVSFFSKDNVLSDDIKICYIFEYQSKENRAFRFFGTPGIDRAKMCSHNNKRVWKNNSSLEIYKQFVY